jgi:hypothetical protein
MKNLLFYILILTLPATTGCNYYMVNKIAKPDAERVKLNIEQLIAKDKYFILHSEGKK